MPSYQQLGYQSDNLLFEPDLSAFAGVVLSPVNYDEPGLLAVSAGAQYRRGYDIVFDPQLYVPRSRREQLRKWSYFPSDVDTADLGSEIWWSSVVDGVVAASSRVKANALCSPIALPKAFTDDYFQVSVTIGDLTAKALESTDIRAIQSAVVGLADLTTPDRAFAIASILSRGRCAELYLVLVNDTEPRRELLDAEELKGAMQLISSLEKADVRVMVAFSSSDVLLWKAAGATSCATGKFFNLRRFTRSRFDDPPGEGGGALPYWFEEELLAFLRESDLVRVRKAGKVSEASLKNPYGLQILEALDSGSGVAWIGLGWRQFLYWFADIERRIATREVDVAALLVAAETNWDLLERAKPQVLMEERFNTGAWLRAWRRALVEYSS